MNFDFGDFAKSLREFKNFFTVKNLTVLLVVAMGLVLICAPQRNDNPTLTGEQVTCSDASCPMPDAQPVAPPLLTEVAQENWQFDLPGSGWVDDESIIPEIKASKKNPEQECMVFMVKEPTGDSFGGYVISTIRSFTTDTTKVKAIKQVIINDNKLVMIQFNNGGEVIWTWLAVKGGFGYGLACGCDINVDTASTQQELCAKIGESLQIK